MHSEFHQKAASFFIHSDSVSIDCPKIMIHNFRYFRYRSCSRGHNGHSHGQSRSQRQRRAILDGSTKPIHCIYIDQNDGLNLRFYSLESQAHPISVESVSRITSSRCIFESVPSNHNPISPQQHPSKIAFATNWSLCQRLETNQNATKSDYDGATHQQRASHHQPRRKPNRQRERQDFFPGVSSPIRNWKVRQQNGSGILLGATSCQRDSDRWRSDLFHRGTPITNQWTTTSFGQPTRSRISSYRFPPQTLKHFIKTQTPSIHHIDPSGSSNAISSSLGFSGTIDQ